MEHQKWHLGTVANKQDFIELESSCEPARAIHTQRDTNTFEVDQTFGVCVPYS